MCITMLTRKLSPQSAHTDRNDINAAPSASATVLGRNETQNGIYRTRPRVEQAEDYGTESHGHVHRNALTKTSAGITADVHR